MSALCAYCYSYIYMEDIEETDWTLAFSFFFFSPFFFYLFPLV